MVQRFPYTPTSGALSQLISQLRKSFPATVDASLLKKLGLAPNNEAYNINVLKFLGLIDDLGAKNADVRALFSIADDAKFSEGFSDIVKRAYDGLFDVHGDDAWALAKSDLLTFFRQSDHTSEIVGNRQVTTFVTLAEIAGKRPAEASKPPAKPKEVPRKNLKPASGKHTGSAAVEQDRPIERHRFTVGEVGVSVKVEVILPNNADAATYDSIFRAIRKNLIDA